ncbi:MAG: DNA-directed RNA polymerase subunit B [Thermoproteota archaeon]
MSIKTEDPWVIIEDVLRKEGIARQHLNSYNDFVTQGLQNIINEIQGIDVDTVTNPYKIKFGKIELGSNPRVIEIDGSTSNIYPMEGRLRGLTYQVPIYLEMSIEENEVIRDTQRQHIGDLPVMVRSDLCNTSKMPQDELIQEGEDPFDPGGYFVINGSERVVVGLEDLSPNKIIVESDVVSGKPVYKAKTYSSIVGYRAKLEIIMKSDGAVQVKLPSSPVDLPLVVIMKALGIKSDKEIADLISTKDDVQELLDVSFEKTTEVKDQSESFTYIGNRVAHGMLDEFRRRKAESVIDWGMLPHIGKTPEDRYSKALFLGEAVNKLLELRLGWIEDDDKDHYGNKIIKFAGQLIADLFRTAFRNLIRDMRYQLERTGQRRGTNVVGASIRPGIITDKLNNAIATGNWGRGKVGVTQLLDRTNYLSSLSHLRRIQSPLSRSQPNFEARDLHSTHYGRICPSETPEGANCGLVKNLAISALISKVIPTEEIVNTLLELGVKSAQEVDVETRSKWTRVFVDGKLIGYASSGKNLVKEFRLLRRKGTIHSHVSVCLFEPINKKAISRIYVSLDSGRVLRPLTIVENGKSLVDSTILNRIHARELSWSDLLKMGVIELLDANEEENAFISIDEKSINSKHTHMEIFPAAILGVTASLIPYPEHNQSPRNTYESAMAKQSLGFPTPTYDFNTSVREHLLTYPQRPIVHTRSSSLLNIDRRPSGQNAIVAVLSYEGYNIEDAIVMNRASIERGLCRSFFYRLYEGSAKQYLGGMKDSFENPEPTVRGYKGQDYYRLLDQDGVVLHESTVTGGDVIIGRTSPPRFIEEYKEFEIKGPYRRDTSIAVRPSEFGVVDSVFMTQNIQGEKVYRVKVRDMRIPEIGDKFASRHGQKGVVGLLVNQEDMPYTESGVTPDLIINPHAFPSRMTVGQFVESIAGKSACLRGTEADGTAFVGEKYEDHQKTLEKHGFKSTGREIMYDGRTGRKLKVDIFIGPVYYQKLHHMVADKIHARARGQVQMLTKQPTEGRARGGGLRFGEMERDCLIAYGASMMLKDRLLDESDKTVVNICEKCGLLAYYDNQQKKYICRIDGDQGQISTVTIAYAFKLLLQEMTSLNIAPRLLLKDKV